MFCYSLDLNELVTVMAVVSQPYGRRVLKALHEVPVSHTETGCLRSSPTSHTVHGPLTHKYVSPKDSIETEQFITVKSMISLLTIHSDIAPECPVGHTLMRYNDPPFKLKG